jgi:radical SAM superfamily enzyme YgiQ (UPF0313 family)
MNILLVSPYTPETFWSFKHAVRFVSRKSAFPPLGLLTVAAMLPRSWNLKLVDQDVSRLQDADLRWADYVLISAMIVHRQSVQKIVERCRAIKKKVIAGGPLFTTGHEHFPSIDHFVLGEVEDILPQVIADMEAGCLKPFYESTERPDVRKTPVPRWDLINKKHYASMSVQFSRGCPYNCEFCDIIVMNGRVPRTKPPDQLLAELDTLHREGWKNSVFLVDDNFIGNKKKVKELLRAIIAWRRRSGARMSFFTEASVNLADDQELLDLMGQAGFKSVFLGIETPEVESLKECRKFQNTRRDLVESVRAIQNAGMHVMGGFIVGFDNDGPDIFERQFEFIQKAGVVTAMVGLLNALPKTQLHSRLLEEGRLLKDTTGNNTEAVLNFVTKLDSDFLIQGYRRLMKSLYEPTIYYQRIRSFMEEYRHRGPREHIDLSQLKAFFRAHWWLGVRYPGRWAYWRFLLHTLFRKPMCLGEAMTLAIYGHHFRLIAGKL